MIEAGFGPFNVVFSLRDNDNTSRDDVADAVAWREQEEKSSNNSNTESDLLAFFCV